jgi:PBSX family phage terminase large subunit
MEAYKQNKRRVILLGGSRSSKSYSVVQWLVWYASQQNSNKTVAIVRETAASFKTTLYTDFREILQSFKLDNPFAHNKQVTQFKIFDTTFHFIGADDYTKIMGLKSDIVFINEYLSVNYDVYNQLSLRCTEMIILDSNPIASYSKYFDLNDLEDTYFIKTTYKDNPYLPDHIIKEIESYNPDNPVNVQKGTADRWMHKVFALGERMPRTGVIYEDIIYIDELPELEFYGFGLDFGMQSHPSVLSVAGVIDNNLYAKSLFYTPTPTVELIHELIMKSIKPYIGINTINIFADSANPLEIAELNKMSKGVYHVYAVYKFNGSVLAGIKVIKSYKLHLVKDKNVIKEAESYVWDSVNGIQLDRPVKNYDHFFDSLKYCVLSNFRKSY